MIGQQRAVRAFLRGERFERGALMVEVRESEPTVDPRSGERTAVPALVVLWFEDRPVAVRLRSVVAISRFPRDARLASLLEAEALAAGLPVERLWEAALWRLFSQPPRPWLAR